MSTSPIVVVLKEGTVTTATVVVVVVLKEGTVAAMVAIVMVVVVALKEGVGQLEAKSAKLSNTSNSEIISAKDSNTCRAKNIQFSLFCI